MSEAGARLAAGPGYAALPKARTPLAHLLHALNQPLTGLHCSLELAVAGPRSTEQYVRTLRESLELTSRMRLLLEALRELADLKPSHVEDIAPILIDGLLLAICDELRPLATEKGVILRVVTTAPLPVRAHRCRLGRILFRLLESALSLCAHGSEMQVVAAPDENTACLLLGWTPGPLPDYSPFSRAELGLLLAKAEWEEASGNWGVVRKENAQTCTLRWPLLPEPRPNSEPGDGE